MQAHRLLRTVAALLPAVAVLAVFPTGESPAGAAPALTQAPLTAAEAHALSKNVTDKVIVVFKNQLAATPDTTRDASLRAAAVAGIQSPVVRELALTRARDVKSVHLLDAVAATVSPGEAKRLAANPAVSEVVKDEPIPVASSVPSSEEASAGASGAASDGGSLSSACAPSGHVQLDPQAVETIHAATQSGTGASAQTLGYTGAGVKVAFIADGLDPDNPDFIRANGRHVFVDYKDFSGTGSKAPTDGAEAFLDASSIAAQGLHTYNVASYGAGLSHRCLIRILGVAPGASLVGLNVFGSSDEVFDSVFLEAIDYAVGVDHVNVINESFGSNPFPDTASLDLIKLADEAAVAAGVTVTASTGDAGVTDTIGSPATDPAVISAGATTTYRSYAQTGIGGINAPGVTGWLDNNISALSSAGIAQDGSTVDVVAPGDANWALCTPNPRLYGACATFAGKPSRVELEEGTSEAAPLTAGTAALVIQAYAEAHGGTDPTPAVVKQIITSTATDIDAPADQQGAGLIDAYAAVLAARSYHGASVPAKGDGLLTSADQLNAVGAPGTEETLHDTLTNDGVGKETIALSSRTLGAYQSVESTTVTVADATGDSAVVHFNVPGGQARLNASIAYTAPFAFSTAFSSALNLSLVAPDGKLAEYNRPQGAGNYGNAQVADPAPGKWTAHIFGLPSVEGGTTGPVLFGASVAPWAPFGTLSASSVSLAPGASAAVSLTVPTPRTPGDEAGAIVLTDTAATPSFTAVTTVPVTLRSLVPTPAPSTTFTGTLTGGNGRDTDTGQSAYYQVEVPAGLPVLNAQISTANVNDTFVAELVNPVTGEADSTAANTLYGIGANGGTVPDPQPGAQLHVLDPDAGRWTLVIDFYNQVSGTALSQPFTVTLDTTPVTASAAGLPDSAGTTLKAGSPVTVDVRVTNDGSTSESYFVDGRLDRKATLSLVSLTNSEVFVPLSGTAPEYLVPSHTTSITARASAPAPIFFDYSWAFGDPDLMATTDPYTTTPSGTFTSSSVADGVWAITPFQDGPDGRHGVAPVLTQTSMTATSAAFDPAVSSPTGDLWQQSLAPNTAVHPYVVDPGQTVTIPVTITPAGTKGTTVTGTLFLGAASLIDGIATENEFPGLFPEASDVAAFSYAYTIG